TVAGAAARIRCSWMRIGTGVASSPPSELIEDEPHRVMGRDGSSLESSRREASLPVRGPGSSAGEGAPGAAGAASDGAGIEVLRRWCANEGAHRRPQPRWYAREGCHQAQQAT